MGSKWLGPRDWLSQFLKVFDMGSKERTAVELKTLVRCLWLSGVDDQLNAPNLCCLEEITGVCINLSRLTRADPEACSVDASGYIAVWSTENWIFVKMTFPGAQHLPRQWIHVMHQYTCWLLDEFPVFFGRFGLGP